VTVKIRYKIKCVLSVVFLLGSAMCFIPSQAWGQISITLGWQASSDPTIAGYNVYYGTVSQQYTNEIPVGDANSVTINGLVPGVTYYFAATSYNSQNQQSAFTPEISYTVPQQVVSQPPILTGMLSTNAAMEGQNLIFAVGATGSGPLSYQWMFNNSPLPSATSSILVLTNVSTSQAGVYNVVVSDSTGSTNSPNVNLAVYPTSVPTVAPAHAAKGQYALNVSGVANYEYVVQASTNLVNWVSIATNVSPFTFVDSNASQFPRRFYRSSYTATSSSGSSSPAINGLVAWYPLAGDLNDYSGNGNNATGAGTIAFITGPMGNQNTALGFDGADTYASANNASSLIANSTGITISGWIAIQDTNASYGGFGMRTPGDGPGAFFINVLSNGQFQGRFRNASGTATTIGAPFATSVWTFVSLTYDGSTLTLYVNGVAAASAPASGTFGVGNLPFYIGGTGYMPPSNLPDFPMAGIRLYNAALSSSAIQQLYNQGMVSGIF
jgi:hypothetical protein